LYRQAIIIALAGNILLLTAKGFVAWISGSAAIFAEAANSASDVAYSLLMVVGLWMSLRPPDLSHPHGHRRYEPLVSIVIGAMMTYAGIKAGLTGYQTWRNGPQAITSVFALMVPVLTVAIKWFMYKAVSRIGKEAASPALLASARDNLADVVTSTAALLGVALNRWVWPVADPVAAFVVSLWIFRNAGNVLWDSIKQLVGAAAPPELTQQVVDKVRAVPGVLGVHQVIIEYVGPQVRVDLHIDMDGRLPLEQVHRVSDAVRQAVEAMEEVDHAFIHVEPAQTHQLPQRPSASRSRRSLRAKPH
jgi:cation diffusion facilitator family transporter